MTKVLFVQLGLLADGSSIALLNLLLRLKSHNIEPIVVLAIDNDYCRKLKDNNIKYYIVPFRLSVYKKYNSFFKSLFLSTTIFVYTMIINILAIARIVLIVLKNRVALIHTNVGPIHIGFFVAKICRIPHVWHLREIQGTRYTSKPIFTLSYLKRLIWESHAICVSKSVANHFCAENCISSEVIYDGVFNLNSIPSVSYKQKKEQFLFVGRIEPAKGLDELLDAFVEFKKRNSKYKLICVGRCDDNSYQEHLINKAVKAGIDNDVIFTGVREDVAHLMNESLSTIISSRTEGFGFVTAEAMYNGSLVIGYNVEGTKEQMDNVEMRYTDGVYRYSDISELISQMEKVVALDSVEYEKKITTVQKIVEDLYNVDLNCNSIVNYYNKIMKDDFCLSGNS